jgi:hypothetical protein
MPCGRIDKRRPCTRHLLAGLLALTGAACATYDERVAPVPLPESQVEAVDIGGALVVATAFVEPRSAQQAFGFDVRGAGVLPVQFVVDNRSGASIAIVPEQTFLLDHAGNAWPVLDASRAAERIRSKVADGETIRSGAQRSFLLGFAGAVAGAAIAIVSGENVGSAAGKGAVAGAAIGGIAGGASRYNELGSEVRRDLANRSLQNRQLNPGELAHGFLFFPGKNEAESARALRLALRIGNTVRIATLTVREAHPPGN